VVHQVLQVRKARKEQQVLLALLVQQGHKVQPAQRELQDHLEVEAEHLDHKVQLVRQVQPVLQELRVQPVQRERQALREQLVPQVQQEQQAQQVLLVYQMLQLSK
jgi:hypothetical protein